MKKIFFILSLFAAFQANAQEKYPIDSVLLKNYKFRCIGPFRGGRASDACGDVKNKNTFYMASCGGGIWKTQDAGTTWKNISDGYFGGSMGAIAVSAQDPYVLYAGGGESTVRGNVSEGKGMYKSNDGGRTWKHIGLEDSRHICKIKIHPKNDNIVYVAALGHLFGPNEERGIFKTANGGKTWKRILYKNENVGAVDIQLDPSNPEILYASLWRVRRTAYDFSSGGDGSALWKSIDGGETWTEISKNKGFPKDTLGIICTAIAPSNPDKIYALVESKTGGLYCSNDGGINWEKRNEQSDIRQRAWYFSRLAVHPQNENQLYICNVGFYKSLDGGKTIQGIGTPHGDHHGIWIDPDDGNRMIIADDGGAQVSVNGGESWSTYMNQPTAQFYRVSTDNHFPFRVLGCQQDNSSMRIASRTYHGEINQNDWQVSAGFESGHIVASPNNPEIVYGGNYGGYLSRLNHITNENRTISVWPISPIGEGADVLKYRFQWNFPLFISPHNPNRIYAAGNELFVSEDEGHSWKSISPDLTTNDKSKQKPSGGIITKDNTGVEYYCTIFAACESPVQKDVLWCGSDDGLVHVSKDGGKNWENVTPASMPEWTMMNCIEASTFDAGTCYVVGTRYKLDDTHPYIYKTENFGRSWKRIDKDLPENYFTRALRADPNNKGVLYCGTEQGLFISINDGNSWLPMQLNLPIVPITDLAIKDASLIVATQGRSFWILDDINFIVEALQKNEWENHYFFQPKYAYRTQGYKRKNVEQAGENPDNGVVFNFLLDKNFKEKDSLSILILHGPDTIKSIANYGEKPSKDFKPEAGMNQYLWDMRVDGVERIDKMILWNGNIDAIKVPSGNYKAILQGKNFSETKNFEIKADPNYEADNKDYENQFALLMKIKNKFSETQQCIKNIRNLKSQIEGLKTSLGKNYPKELDSLGKNIIKIADSIENNLYQTKAKSGQDVLNYPIKLNDKLAGLFDAANQNTKPSQQVIMAYQELEMAINKELDAFSLLEKNEIKKYNEMVRQANIDLIRINKN